MSIRRLIVISLISIALAESWNYRQPLLSALHWFTDPNAVIKSVQEYGVWGAVVLFVLFILQVFFALIPGQALMVASGYIYGFTGGMLITWTSLVVGGQVAFWLARRYGRPFAEKWVSPPILDRWDKSAAGQGLVFYTVTLVMPFFPNDAMCYVAGLGKMSFRRFLLANVLGRGIASLFTVIVGAYGKQVPALIWIAVIGFIALGIIGWFAAKRYSKFKDAG